MTTYFLFMNYMNFWYKIVIKRKLKEVQYEIYYLLKTYIGLHVK